MFDNIVLFTQLVENGSYSKTAEKLNISPSTLSRKIQDLEAYFNQLLMIRDTRSFELTEFGQSLYNNFKDLKHQLNRFILSMKSPTDYSEGEINISLPVVRSMGFISPYISYFNKKYSNITLNLFYQYKELDLKQNKIDIAVTAYKIEPNKVYTSEFLRSEPIQLYCTPDYVKKYGLPLDIAELYDHSIIGGIDINEVPIKYINFKNSFTQEEQIFESNSTIKVNNAIHALEIGFSGEHIFFSWSYKADKLIKQGKLIRVLPEYIAHQTDLYIVYRRNPDPRELLFIDFIRKCAKGRFNPETY
ncbi:MAG: LysR family transcriptional regulator [Neisseriales bacterium]|nr:MAG: LysR family transcriptional regulator [Neisseriales bacterium]